MACPGWSSNFGPWPLRNARSPGRWWLRTTIPTDESGSVVREWASRFHMIRLVDVLKSNGPGGCRTAGVEAAGGDLLAFCDADDVVQPGWLNAHVSALADADLSAGVFDVWSLNGSATPSFFSYAPPPALALFGFLPAAGSNNLALRRHAFEDVGGFSDDLLTGEDFDLSWACGARGTSLRPEHRRRGCETEPTGLQGGVQAVHRLWTVRPNPLSTIPGLRAQTRPGSRCEDVGVVACVDATALPARVSRPLGADRRMENWSLGGVSATEGALPLRRVDYLTPGSPLSSCRP